MVNILAILLAPIMISTSPSNSIIKSNYSDTIEPTALNKPTYIYTPQGSKVYVKYKSNIFDYDLEKSNNGLLTYFQTTIQDCDTELVKPGGSSYNNYSYAFYMYWGYQYECIIEDFNPYLEDKSFYQVDKPEPKDIVCYRFKDTIIHSGIILEVNDTNAGYLGNNLKVESKWGGNGVFRHRGDLCPYIKEYLFLFQNEIKFAADNLIFYRRHEKHNLKIIKDSNNDMQHTEICEECGDVRNVSHSFTFTVNNIKTHRMVCLCGYEKLENHNFVTFKNERYCNKCFYYPDLSIEPIQ